MGEAHPTIRLTKDLRRVGSAHHPHSAGPSPMKPFLKQTPTLLVIGVTGFVAYTVVFAESDHGPPRSESKPPSPTKITLEVASSTMRNPFLMDLPPNPEATPTGEKAAEKGPDAVASTPQPDAPAELPVDDDRVLESMKLVGTFVDAREQLAIIDNKVYARGDRLRGIDGTSLPYVIIEVRKDRALLRRGHRDFTIAFSDVPRAAPPRAAPTPKSAEEKTGPKTETVAKFTPIGKSSRKGRSAGFDDGKAGAGDQNTQRDLLLQLLSSMGGSQGGGLSSDTGSGVNSSALNALVNPTTIGAGLDAIMGKNDNLGQAGGSGP